MSLDCVYCFYDLKKILKLIQGQEVRACDWLPEVSTQLHIAYGQGTFHSEFIQMILWIFIMFSFPSTKFEKGENELTLL